MKISNIHTIGVMGIGTMGAGIAQAFAEGGYDVICYNRSQSGIDRGMKLIHSNQDTLIKNGVLTKERADSALKKLRTTLKLEDLADVDFVCEAVAEDIDIKKRSSPN